MMMVHIWVILHRSGGCVFCAHDVHCYSHWRAARHPPLPHSVSFSTQVRGVLEERPAARRGPNEDPKGRGEKNSVYRGVQLYVLGLQLYVLGLQSSGLPR